MGQIVARKARPDRCNLRSLSSFGTPAAGEIILVSSDNSAMANGQGNFDCYIMGDGSTEAILLELKDINELKKYFLSPNPNIFPPDPVAVEKRDDNVTYTITGTTLAVTVSVNVNKWFYIKISTGAVVGKTYKVSFKATNVGTSPVRYATDPLYDDVNITPDEDDVYSFTFVGSSTTSYWIGLQNVRNKTITLTDIVIKQTNPELVLDKSIVKGLTTINFDEQTAEKINNSVQYELSKLLIVRSSAMYAKYVSVRAINEAEGSVTFYNGESSTKPLYFLFAGKAGHTYKVSVDTTQRGQLIAQDSKNNTITSESLPQGGGTTQISFIMPADGYVSISLSTYSTTTQVATNFYAYDITEPVKVPNDEVVALPQENILHDYDVIDNVILSIPNGNDVDVFLHGMVNTYTPADQYSFQCLYAFILNGGYTRHFTIASSAAADNSYKAFIYDQYGRTPFYLRSISVSENNPLSNKNVFIVGDSLTARKVLPTEYRTYLDNGGLTNVTMIGQYTGNGAGAKYEAVGGRAWPDYTSDPSTLPSGHTNPFWINGQLDYAAYFTTYCNGAVPDIVVCELGWNQIIVYGTMTDAQILTLIHTFLDGMLALNANCKFILCGIHRGLADDYGYYRRLYLEGSVRLARLYKSVALDPTYSNCVIYANIASYFDAEAGMQISTRQISGWSAETEKYVVDPVHPNNLGMKMHAYAMYLYTLYWL